MPGDQSPSPYIEDHFASGLRIAVMRLRRRLRAESAEGELTLTQVAALATLDREGPMSPSALADFERVQPPSMTRVIAALEQLKLVARDPHPSDRRVSVIAVTEAGHRLLEEERRRRDEWLTRVLEALEPDERDALRAAVPILDRLANA